MNKSIRFINLSYLYNILEILGPVETTRTLQDTFIWMNKKE